MNLQKKIILLMFLTGAILLSAQLIVSNYVTNTQIADMEKEKALGQLDKTHYIIHRELQHLRIIANVLSETGDCAFDLMKTNRDSLKGILDVRENFLPINKLNLLMVYNKDGVRLFGKSMDLASGRYLNVENNFEKTMPKDHILFNHGINTEKILGVYVVDSTPMLIASVPIAEIDEKDRNGFIVGTVIIGRFLDRNLLPAFRYVLDVQWEAESVENFKQDKPDIKIDDFPIKKPIITNLEDSNDFVIYDSYPALNDPRGIVIDMKVKGGTLRSATEKLSYIVDLSVAFGLIAFILFAVFFNNLIVIPIRQLTKQVQGIQKKSLSNITLNSLRKDELGILSLEFNKLLGQLSNRSEELALLGSLDNLLAACSTTTEAGEVFKRIAVKLLSKCSGALAIINGSGNLFEIEITWGGEWPGELVYSPGDCWALRRGQVHSMSDNSSSPICNHMSEGLPHPAICIPLVAQGDTLGVLHVMTKHEFTENEIQLAESLAKHTSLALANLRLREALHIQAIRDPLTGLYNRRYLEESIERELSRAKREKSTVGVFMIDLDHFKRFNDDFGHEAGDYVLKQLGLTLKHFIRNEDIACRYGGEEFTVILPGADIETCKERGEMLCDTLRKMDLRFRDRELGIITLSIGVALSPDHGENGEAILSAADRALYRAKSNGRDRVEVAL